MTKRTVELDESDLDKVARALDAQAAPWLGIAQDIREQVARQKFDEIGERGARGAPAEPPPIPKSKAKAK